jgi:nucleoside-diphosphate-sugar epimerase
MIYITGSEGFVGKCLQQKLKKPYACIDRKIGIDLLKIDWNIFIKRNSYPNTVIHLAAETNPRDSAERIEEIYLNNVVVTKKIFETFPRSRIIYISTSLVKHDLQNFYAMSKYLNEIDAKFHDNALGLRATTVYGENARDNMVVPRIINNNLSYVTSYERDFIWVEDFADLIIQLIDSDKCGIINIATGDVHKINELAESFGVCSESFNPNDEPETNVLNAEYLQSIGWKHKMTVRDYIKGCK